MKKTNSKETRKTFTIIEKYNLIKYSEENPHVNQASLQKKFQMSAGTVCRILSKKIEIKEKYFDLQKNKKNKKIIKNLVSKRAFESIDEPLFDWFVKKRGEGKALSNHCLKTRSKKIAVSLGVENFQASNTWIENFKSRHGIKSRVVSGEEELVDMKAVYEKSDEFFNSINEYEPKNIFNVDETGLFFKCPPKKGLVLSHEEKISGKFPKERITIMLACSQEGEKLPPLIIGKAKKPRWIKDVQDLLNIISYRSSPNAWMNSNIFSSWLKQLNDDMISKDRKIALLLDNAPCHNISKTYSNIKLMFLPKNSTSKVQPLDQGVIKSLKDKYRTHFRNEMNLSDLSSLEFIKKVIISDIIPLLIRSWDEVTVTCIQNCFNHAFKNFKKPEEEREDFPIEEKNKNESSEKYEEPMASFNENNLILQEDFEETIIFHEVENNEDDENEEEIIIGKQDALNHLKMLEKYFCSNDQSNLKFIYKIKDNITSSMKKNLLVILKTT